MPEYGYSPEMEKYRKLAADEEETESENSDRDDLIERATGAFDAATGNLPAELQEKFQQILDDAETYYDLDPALGAEVLETAAGLLEEFADISDEDEIEERASDLQPEIDQLVKISGRLAKKGTH